ncbi:MAG: M20/M25/M40 family metallo-hydrolase [Bdellovibrionales bacterium]|nr:M20/M25/M40 family metallo-hydrolase [Bdellovibrionales bacterium]
MARSKDKQPDLIGRLKRLVEIDSPTSDFKGVEKVLKWTEAELKRLGFKTRRIRPEKAVKSPALLFAEMKSKSVSAPVITLITHADTVFDSGFHGFKVSKDRKTATGPGVIDDKGGIVIALEGLRLFLSRLPKKASAEITLQFICAPSEEIGSPGFHGFLAETGKKTWMALGFEPALETGDIIQTRRGNRWYRIDVQGAEAHSGREPEKGVNAAHELAHKIVGLEKIGIESPGASVQTGIIQGGTRTNVVCGHAHARVDVRYSDFGSRDQVHSRIADLMSRPSTRPSVDGKRAQISLTLDDDCPPVPSPSPDTGRWVDEYLKSLGQAEGKTLKAGSGGGSADVNYMSRPGLIILDGLGATGFGMHQKTETIFLESLKTRSEALADFLSKVPTHRKKSTQP